MQDDDGKIWFQGGASGLPGYWQLPVLYGNFGGGRGAAVGGAPVMDPDLGIPWGAPVRIADMQGGLGATACPTDRCAARRPAREATSCVPIACPQT